MSRESHLLKDVITTEAAKAYDQLDGSLHVDVVLWETLETASRANRLLRRLIPNPGVLIAAIYDKGGKKEYLSWRNEILNKSSQHQQLT